MPGASRSSSLHRHKDLRTGEPVWSERRKPGVVHERLAGDTKTDVLVVGAGISGALVAERLTDAGFDVIVVDRRSPLAGSTSASTALLQYELDTPLVEMTRKLGERAALAIWRRSYLALHALKERTARLGIDADLVDRDGLYLQGDRLDARGLAREADARKRAGFEVELLSRRQLRERYGIRRGSALLGFGGAVVDPRRLAGGYLNVAISRGASIHAPEEVTELREGTRGVIAKMASGVAVRARFVVLATGYELFRGVPATHHAIESTWAIATRPQRSRLWPTECMIWEASDPYLYLRTTSDGRIVCGGEDEPFADEGARDALLSRKARILEKKLKRLFPEVDARAEFAWTGSFGASDTGAPSIGRVPKTRSIFALLGYGGNGVTFSILGSQLISALLGGRRRGGERSIEDLGLFRLK